MSAPSPMSGPGAPLPFSRRLLYVIGAFGAIALMGGAVYGWPSMRPVLRREGALRTDACTAIAPEEPCNEEELSLGLIFTVGSWSNQGGRLFVGILLDRIGPRWTSSLCAAVCCVGAAIFGLVSSTTGFAVGFFCIGIGGAGMQLSLQSVSALFPQNKALVMAMLSGAFQAASGVFLLMETVHRFTDVSLQALMFTYAAILLFVALLSLFIWPSLPFGASPSKPRESNSPTTQVADVDAKAALTVPLNKRSFREQASSPEYLLMTTYFAFTVLQCQFTVGTIGTQFEKKGDSGNLTRIFNLVFSLSWIVTPAVGYGIDRFGHARILIAMNTVLLLSCLCLLIPSQNLQIVTAILYTIGRVSIWAAYFGFNGTIFGFKNYGKLAGGGLFVASCLSLLQYAFLEFTIRVFDGNFAYANGFFVALAFAMYPILFKLACLLKNHQSHEPAPQPALTESKVAGADPQVQDGKAVDDTTERKDAQAKVSV